jgi:hypothetical protein
MTTKKFARRYQTGASLWASAILAETLEEADVEGHAMIGDREFTKIVALIGDIAVRLSPAQLHVLRRVLEGAANAHS